MSLAGYSPWGAKELDMAERLSTAIAYALYDENNKYMLSVYMRTVLMITNGYWVLKPYEVSAVNTFYR